MFKFWSKYSKESVPIAGKSFSPLSTSFMILGTGKKTTSMLVIAVLIMPLLQFHNSISELKIALSLLSNLNQDSVSHYQIQWLSAHNTFLFQLMGFDGLARFIPWGINSLFTRK